MDGNVVLLSGGVDSLVCAELERRSGTLSHCLFVDYGHPSQAQEGWKAFAYCGAREVPLTVIQAFGMRLDDMQSQVGPRLVPARNAVLLSLAANASECGAIVIGCNKADSTDYADCRPDFLSNMATGLGVDIRAPLLTKTKPEIVAMARALGLRRSDSWSCYVGGLVECGTCPSCIEADLAWKVEP